MSLSVALAQINWNIGDIEGNADRIIELVHQHQKEDLIVFSELALTGYFPEDVIFRSDFQARCEKQLDRIRAAAKHCAVIIGHPVWSDDMIYNSLSFFHEGACLRVYHKQKLPNHDVFDEKRYFAYGSENGVVIYKGHRIGLLICEDLWQQKPIRALAAEHIDLLVTINASPYEYEKWRQRQALVECSAFKVNAPVIYLNQVGGQDELVFDGDSFVVDKKGVVVFQLPSFAEGVAVVQFTDQFQIANPNRKPGAERAQGIQEIYAALVLAVKDYVNKNGFKGALLGLSGGIDSALTLAIAVDALGKERVRAVMLPFRYTSTMSQEDACAEARTLGIKLDVISIEPIFDALVQQLEPVFAGKAEDVTEENLQARSRGVVLMALSNKYQYLLLTTGNKSEMAVGYATLYGDMAGGFDVLKDVSKTRVFELARYRNSLTAVIPERVITRPPSAELAAGQIDQDSLPPYEILDAILKGFIEDELCFEDLVAKGYDAKTVRDVLQRVDNNEYKRRQSAIGPKVTPRSFGKGRRYPITCGYRHLGK